MLKRSCIAGVAGLLLPFCLFTPAQADELGWAKRLGKDFRAAHQITRGKGVTVAILDDGVDGKVGSLRGVVTKSKDLVGTRRPKKVHGTLMASLIAGSGPSHDTPFGMRGLAPGTKVLSVRVYPDVDDPGAEDWFIKNDERDILARGIRHAADQGAQVIVVVPTYSNGDMEGIEAAVAYAQAKNSVVVAGNARATDNFSNAANTYPAAATGTIGVGALDFDGEHHRKYSAANGSALVSAPGFAMPAIGPGNKLWTFWGDSAASTWVAAAAALIRAEYPKLSPLQVSQALAISARHPKGKGGYDKKIGFGIVNPNGALKEARRMAESAPLSFTAKTGMVADKEHFGGGAPEKVKAVRHPAAALTGFPGLILAGLLMLGAAVLLFVRSRPKPVAEQSWEASESGDAWGS